MDDWARQAGFILRKRILSAYDFLVLMSLGQLGMKHPSLAGMVDAMDIEMKRESLHERFTPAAVKYLEICSQFVLKQKLQNQSLGTELFDPFKRIFIHDSSGWDVDPKLRATLPGYGGSASDANCKIQVCYEYRTGELSFFKITAGTHPDNRYTQKLAAGVEADDLLITDLGFFCLKTFHDINQKGGFFLSRLMIGTSMLDPQTSQVIDLERMLTAVKEDLYEKQGVMGAEKATRVSCRLICLRVSEQVANERRRRLRQEAKKKGHTPNQRHLALCDWILMVTNVPQKLLPAKMVRPFYSLRWQIGLLFKQLKSILRIHQSDTSNENRLRCEIYGKFIVAVLIHRLHATFNIPLWNTQHKELSMEKFYKRIQERAFSFMQLLFHSLQQALHYLRHEIPRFIDNCMKSYQISRQTTLQILAFGLRHPTRKTQKICA